MHLHTPWAALLAIPVIAAAVLALRRRRPSLQVSGIQPFRDAGCRPRWWHPVNIPVFLTTLGLLALVVALMRPQKGVERIIRRTEGIDIVLLLDVSGSMRAYDVPRGTSMREAARQVQNENLQNRIAVAKEELRKFVKQRPDDRIGLIAFARLPYVVCPPTLDHDFLLQHLDRLDAGMFKDDGTGIAAPVASATSRLKDSPAKRRVAVLFTDGENNVKAKISPKQAARIAAGFDIAVYTVGIGGAQALTVVDSWFGGRRLRPVASGLDRQLLEAIAEETDAVYFPARDAAMFANVMNRIDKLEKVDLEVPRYVDYKERFMPWLIAGALLVTLGLVAEETLFLVLP